MMQGLNAGGRIDAMHGARGRVLPIVRTCLAESPDYIHFDWTYSYFLRRYRAVSWAFGLVFLLELLVARFVFRCRIVWTLHNLESHEGLQPALERMVHRILARHCDWIRVLYPSLVEPAARHLRVPTAKVRSLPEGSYVGYYENHVTGEAARRTLEIDENAFVFLTLGNVRPYKGIEDYIDVIKRLDYPELRVIIAGPCRLQRLEERIRQKAATDGRIRLDLNFIDESELQIYFNASDVVVLPFEHVSNSGSAILAMGFAKPIIAPAIGAIPERLRQQAELLYEPGQLEMAIQHVVGTDRNDLRIIGGHNLAAVQMHDWRAFQQFFLS